MKKIYFAVLVLSSFASCLYSRSVFWSENFSISSGVCDPTSSNYGWSKTNIGAQGTFANEWYIYFPVNCLHPDTCFGFNTDSSQGALYISYGGACDSALSGAVYREGCLNATNKRIESPLIDCTGKTNIKLDFDYMASIFSISDYGSLLYSEDGGANWIILQQPLNSGYCPNLNHSGFWKHFQVGLPQGAENNPNVKLAFEWKNNDDCYGALYSIAIDNLELSFECEISAQLVFADNSFDELCAGANYTYAVNPVNISFSYEWSLNGNNLGLGANKQIHFENPGTYNIYVTIIDTNGCTDHIDTSVVVHGFNLSLSTDPDTICPNQCIKFDCSVNPSTSPNYSWYFPNGVPLTSTIKDPTSCFSQVGSHLATLQVSDTANTTCSRTKSIQFFVDTCGYPVLTSITNNLGVICICAGTCLDFSSDAYDASSYSWAFESGNPSTSTTVSPTNICFDTAGVFNIGLSISNSTGSAMLSSSLYVYEPPDVPLFTYDSITHNITITNLVSGLWYELQYYDSTSGLWVAYPGYYDTNPIAIPYLGYSYKVKAITKACSTCFTYSDPIFVPSDN